MAAPNPTIRLFVSSTFSDLKAERNASYREAFLRLKQLCRSKGLRSPAIDRLTCAGASSRKPGATTAPRICPRELRRCQQDRPKPNFLILLGDHYGSPNLQHGRRNGDSVSCSVQNDRLF